MVRKPVDQDELDRREKSLEAKHGGPEGLKAKRREWQAKSRITYVKNGAKGGFRAFTPEKLRETSKLGTEAKKQKRG